MVSLFSINPLILPHKAAEASLVKIELSLEDNGGKEFELAKVVLSGLQVGGGKPGKSH